jgi:hypothetical protein
VPLLYKVSLLMHNADIGNTVPALRFKKLITSFLVLKVVVKFCYSLESEIHFAVFDDIKLEHLTRNYKFISNFLSLIIN